MSAKLQFTGIGEVKRKYRIVERDTKNIGKLERKCMVNECGPFRGHTGGGKGDFSAKKVSPLWLVMIHHYI